MIPYHAQENNRNAIYGSQSKDSFEGDIDSIVVGGVRLNMVDLDTYSNEYLNIEKY